MESIDRLIELDKNTSKKIAVVGCAMEDVYIHGQLASCQEDCYSFKEESRVSVPGGAANAARSLSNWNASVALFSNHQDIQPIKTRFLVNGKFMWRHDLDQIDCEAILAERRKSEFAKLKSNCFHGCLISDYAKGFLTPAFIRQVIDLANERGVPVVADAKREPSIYAGAIIKANKDYCGRMVLGTYVERMVVTQGCESPIVFGTREEGLYTQLPEMKPVACKNHVGAGDCFAAHLTLALAHKMSLQDACAIAHSAGRVYVQAEHNQPPAVGAIRADMSGGA